jgi:hypothetical protein
MSDDMKSVKIPEFNGKEAEWDMCSRKFQAIATIRGYKSVLLGNETPPTADKDLTTIIDTADRAFQKKLRAGNESGYRDLLLAMKNQTEFNIISQATSEALPDGDLKLAWDNIKDEFKPETGNEYVQLEGEFYKASLDDKNMSVAA